MTTTIYIVRHGESEGNINGDIYGGDPPLTQIGIEQAEALAEFLLSKPIDIIYSSHLKRAYQTAQKIADRKKLKVNRTKELRERFFGKLEGKKITQALKTYPEKYKEFPKLTAKEQLTWKIVEDMETLEEVYKRTIAFLNKISKIHKGQSVLFVTHAHLMLSLLTSLGFATLNQLPYGSIKNTGYIKIKSNSYNHKIAEVFGITKTS